METRTVKVYGSTLKELRNMARIASSDPTRVSLQSMLLHDDLTVATDGMRLIRGRFSELDGQLGWDEKLTHPFTWQFKPMRWFLDTADLASERVKGPWKGKRKDPIDHATYQITIRSKHGHGTSWPDYEQVLPARENGQPNGRITLDLPEEIEGYCKAVRALKKGARIVFSKDGLTAEHDGISVALKLALDELGDTAFGLNADYLHHVIKSKHKWHMPRLVVEPENGKVLAPLVFETLVYDCYLVMPMRV